MPNNIERDNRIAILSKRGVTYREIAERFGLTPARISTIARQMGASKVRTRIDIRRLHSRIMGGIPLAVVAKHIGLSTLTLTDMLHQAGLWMPDETSPQRLRLLERIAREYMEGGTVRSISKRITSTGHKISREEVRRCLIDYGVTLRPRGARPIPSDDIRLAYTDYRRTHSLVETGVKFDISAGALAKRFKDNGLPLYPLSSRKPIDSEALEPEWADKIELASADKSRSVVINCEIAGDRSEIFLKFSEARNGQALPTGTRTIAVTPNWTTDVDNVLRDRLKSLGYAATGRRGIRLLLAGLKRAIGDK